MYCDQIDEVEHSKGLFLIITYLFSFHNNYLNKVLTTVSHKTSNRLSFCRELSVSSPILQSVSSIFFTWAPPPLLFFMLSNLSTPPSSLPESIPKLLTLVIDIVFSLRLQACSMLIELSQLVLIIQFQIQIWFLLSCLRLFTWGELLKTFQIGILHPSFRQGRTCFRNPIVIEKCLHLHWFDVWNLLTF